jgi:hypothetical protein
MSVEEWAMMDTTTTRAVRRNSSSPRGPYTAEKVAHPVPHRPRLPGLEPPTRRKEHRNAVIDSGL